MAHLSRIAVVGAGFMARRRAAAFLATGRAAICGVVAAHRERAQAFAAELGEVPAVASLGELLALAPDAVLIEVPHAVQDGVARQVLEAGRHALIGGPLASTAAAGAALHRLAEERGCLVEAGFEARYKASWEAARDLVQGGRIGRPVAVRAVALWNGRPESWYYDQEASGGMPLTHMTYCFLNPLRWLLGDPTHVSAFANRKKHTAPHLVREETAVANLLFPGEVPASLTAGYVRPGDGTFWEVTLVGTDGVIELSPTEMDNGTLRLSYGEETGEVDCADARDAFVVQAEAFLDTLAGDDRRRNRPQDVLGDLTAAEAIVTSARELRTVALG